MSLTERLLLGLDSQVGVLLAGLVVLLTTLGLVYGFMAWRQQRRDRLAYLFRSYYEKAERLLKNFSFGSTHKVDFFGRETVGKFPEGHFGLCRIPPPDLVDAAAIERFRTFHRVMEPKKISQFASYLWTHEDEVLITIQGDLLTREGQLFPGGREYLLDHRLTEAETEQVLLELARGLAKLHELKTESGRGLYHGFLLPRSLYLDLSDTSGVNRIVVSDVGMTFALGAAKVHERLEKLREGSLVIERYYGKELLEQLSMLSPEQKNPKRFHEVGPRSDLYSFAALACMMFMKRKFSSVHDIDWSGIPERWHQFLKLCLSEKPSERPYDFHELEDWLFDPELALTRQEMASQEEVSTLKVGDVELVVDEEVSLEAMAGILDRVKTSRRSASPARSTSNSKNAKIASAIDKGSRAIQFGKWPIALELYERAYRLDPKEAEACLGLAIVHYEMGDLKKSEDYYLQAKEIDESAAKRFREHLTFRV